MIGQLLAKVIGTQNDRELKRLWPVISKVNALESSIESLSDADLRAKTGAFKERVAGGESIDDLLPEAFAVVREAGRRVLNMRHYDVQLIGGMVLHSGKIAEMKTGEGKTLVATLPAYLNALEGKGVHVVTVNDYLARRDSEWMGKVYRFLGLSVGVILSGEQSAHRREQYLCGELGLPAQELPAQFPLTRRVEPGKGAGQVVAYDCASQSEQREQDKKDAARQRIGHVKHHAVVHSCPY